MKESNKNVGLPNLFPFKAEVIESLERKKLQKQELEKIKRLKEKKDRKVSMNLENAEKETDLYEKNHPDLDEEEDEKYENDPILREKKKYNKELKKVIEASDVFIFFKKSI